MHEDTFHTKASNEAYRVNYKKIFGDNKVEKGRFVMVDGKIVPYEEAKTEHKGLTVISDMEEGVSPITGEVITGRRAMREHCKQHNVYYIGR